MKKSQKFKQNWTKNSSGITLIALVITIIVLLILAGVSLNLVMGNQGILNQATSAVDKHNEAKEAEEQALQEAEWSAEYYQKKYVKNDATLPDTVEEYISQKKGESGNTPTTPTEPTYETLSSQITVTNYGDYVDLGTNYVKGNTLETGTATEDWRIFHEDSTGGVYLILADFLPFSYETNATAGSSTGLGTGLKNYGADYPYNWRSETSRTDLIDRLNGTSAWNKLLSSTYIDKGITVKGALTLDEWVASWNAKNDTELFTQYTTGGYLVGNTNPPTTYYYNLASDAGYENTLYFPHRSYDDESGANGYWLATPSPVDSWVVMSVENIGEVRYEGYISYYVSGCVRPAVYLPSGINAEKNAEGVWEIK